uniref:Bm13561 n=1 Tax=Brugia malayi TaxID=6279 RepID=A0A1I9G572_BRUMA|nr:Bm13561 [Brugia malayi]
MQILSIFSFSLSHIATKNRICTTKSNRETSQFLSRETARSQNGTNLWRNSSSSNGCFDVMCIF